MQDSSPVQVTRLEEKTIGQPTENAVFAEVPVNVSYSSIPSEIHFILALDASASMKNEFPRVLKELADTMTEIEKQYPEQKVTYRFVRCNNKQLIGANDEPLKDTKGKPVKDIKISEELTSVTLQEMTYFFGEPEGATPAADTLEATFTYSQEKLKENPTAKVHVITLTDGKPNLPSKGFENTQAGQAHKTKVAQAQKAIQQKKKGVKIPTVSDKDLMEDFEATAKRCQEKISPEQSKKISSCAIGIGDQADPRRMVALSTISQNGSTYLWVDTENPGEKKDEANEGESANKKYPHTYQDIRPRLLASLPPMGTRPAVKPVPGVEMVENFLQAPHAQITSTAPYYVGDGKGFAKYKVLVKVDKNKLAELQAAGKPLLELPECGVSVDVRVGKVLEVPTGSILSEMTKRTAEFAIATYYKPQEGELERLMLSKTLLGQQAATAYEGLELPKGFDTPGHFAKLEKSYAHIGIRLSNILSIYASADKGVKEIMASLTDRTDEIAPDVDEKLRGQVTAINQNNPGGKTTREAFTDFLASEEKIKEQVVRTEKYYRQLSKIHDHILENTRALEPGSDTSVRREAWLAASLESVEKQIDWLNSLLELEPEKRKNVDVVRVLADNLMGVLIAAPKGIATQDPEEAMTYDPWEGAIRIVPNKEVSVADVYRLKATNLTKELNLRLPDEKELPLLEGEHAAGLLPNPAVSHGADLCVAGLSEASLWPVMNARVRTTFYDAVQQGDFVVYKAWLPFKAFIEHLLNPDREKESVVNHMTLAEWANLGSDTYTRRTNSGDAFNESLFQEKLKCHPNEFLLFLAGAKTLGRCAADGLPDNWEERAPSRDKKYQKAPKIPNESKSILHNGRAPTLSFQEIARMGFARTIAFYARKLTETHEQAMKKLARELFTLNDSAQQTEKLLTTIFGGTTPQHLQPLLDFTATALFAKLKLASLRQLRLELGSAADAEISYDPNPDAKKARELIAQISIDPTRLLVCLAREVFECEEEGIKLCDAINGTLLLGMSEKQLEPTQMAAHFEQEISKDFLQEIEARRTLAEKEAVLEKQFEMLSNFGLGLEDLINDLISFQKNSRPGYESDGEDEDETAGRQLHAFRLKNQLQKQYGVISKEEYSNIAGHYYDVPGLFTPDSIQQAIEKIFKEDNTTQVIYNAEVYFDEGGRRGARMEKQTTTLDLFPDVKTAVHTFLKNPRLVAGLNEPASFKKKLSQFLEIDDLENDDDAEAKVEVRTNTPYFVQGDRELENPDKYIVMARCIEIFSLKKRLGINMVNGKTYPTAPISQQDLMEFIEKTEATLKLHASLHPSQKGDKGIRPEFGRAKGEVKNVFLETLRHLLCSASGGEPILFAQLAKALEEKWKATITAKLGKRKKGQPNIHTTLRELVLTASRGSPDEFISLAQAVDGVWGCKGELWGSICAWIVKDKKIYSDSQIKRAIKNRQLSPQPITIKPLEFAQSENTPALSSPSPVVTIAPTPALQSPAGLMAAAAPVAASVPPPQQPADLIPPPPSAFCQQLSDACRDLKASDIRLPALDPNIRLSSFASSIFLRGVAEVRYGFKPNAQNVMYAGMKIAVASIPSGIVGRGHTVFGKSAASNNGSSSSQTFGY